MAPALYDKNPQPGDLIEIFRGVYKHWAVFVGDKHVVHLVVPRNPISSGSLLFSSSSSLASTQVSSSSCQKAVVRKDMFWDVVLDDKWIINNSLDKKYTSRPVEDILSDALSQVGGEPNYDIFSWNCEHFATNLRYGKPDSRQVREAAAVASVGGVIAVFGALAVFVISLLTGAFRN